MSTATARLPPLIASAKVVMFSWVSCPFCLRAKQLLGTVLTNSEDLKVYDIDKMGQEGNAIQAEIIAATNHETVPAIWIKGKFVGGFSDLSALNQKGQLKDMLK